MADIFNEIDEELRRDRLRKLWERYGVLMIAAAVAVVVAVAGWTAWTHWRAEQARLQGDAFAAAVTLAGSDGQAAEDALLALAKTASGGYPALAELRAAATLAERDEEAAAMKAFDGIAAKPATPALLAEVARIRAAYLALDVEDDKAIEARVSPLALAGKPFRHQAREILALSAWKAGDDASARRWLDAIEADAETPRDLLDRTAVLTALVQARTPAGKVD